MEISYYEEIAVLNREHRVTLVRHREKGGVFVKKELELYNAELYRRLKEEPVPGVPRILLLYEEADTLTVIEEYISGETLADSFTNYDEYEAYARWEF